MRQKLLTLSKENGDFRIETFRSGGKGGQHQNTTDSGVRVVHVKTGLSAESRTERSQKQNLKIAFKNLSHKPEFQNWLKLESARMAGYLKSPKEIEKEVDNTMSDEFLKVEVNVDGKWTDYK